MTKSILITQCLQNDFVKPIKRHDPLPNLLHVGFEEARRLMGEDPNKGPIALMMNWAYQQPSDKLSIIHIRDWHDIDDVFQTQHLHQFGDHCLIDSKGSDFAFSISNPDRDVKIVNSRNLNDFIDTDLEEYFNSLKLKNKIKVGLIGVWTEAKVYFLAYELTTRYPNLEIAVCSALTASSSRSHHFMALDQLKRLLGIKIFSSIGEFSKYLSDDESKISITHLTHSDIPKIIKEEEFEISDTDLNLIRFLFRDCREIQIRLLTGGYSGNLILSTESTDLHGHQQVPHVVKIGEQGSIGQERAAFERIEGVLGNNAPRITDFADYDERGALKYRYAAMGGGFSNTFQKLYCAGLSHEKTKYFLNEVFKEQLGRFYIAGISEQKNLLEYYGVIPDFAEKTKKNIENILGTKADAEILTLPSSHDFPNPYHFYKYDLPEIFNAGMLSYMSSFIHGDLNGANIIIDAHENVWLIDFFHTGRGHMLRDLIKLENDLLYIFTPTGNEEELACAIELLDLLLNVVDLGRPLPSIEETGLKDPEIRRAYKTIQILRSFYPNLVKEDRNILQLLIAQIRYTGHTLIFEESNKWQKMLALYTLGKCCEKVNLQLRRRGPLRIDWIDDKYTQKGKLGMTILPGRKDYGRNLTEDIEMLKKLEVTHVVTLTTLDELGYYGVDELIVKLLESGFIHKFFPIRNQYTSSVKDMKSLIKWLDDNLKKGKNVMVHCVGGIGRSGLVCGCYLVSRGLDPELAINEVRKVRSERAIESRVQEEFIKQFK